ncbi:transposase [Acetobacter malorum]|uniref:Transposase n=1 Tax=Acetobacter malorum TaxID=178901 RepID=A0A177GBF5_9PROT|nr:transposase [Acetobacter malorum]
MKQADFLNVKERLTGLSRLGDRLKAFSRTLWILKFSTLIQTRIWPTRMKEKAALLHLIRLMFKILII